MAKKIRRDATDAKVRVTRNGPYRVSGGLPMAKDIAVAGRDGIPARWERGEKFQEQAEYSLCRCGKSGNKPYCDGSHATSGFDGTETAGRKRFSDQARIFPGPRADLADAVGFCSLARFCDRAGTVWNLVERDDEKARKAMVQESCDCPSGRLVALDKKGKRPIEPKLKPSIGIIEDPPANVSGPIWLKGGVPVESADGKAYEVRNRVTLCRCGKSSNKPFCDGTHIQVRFNDGDKRLKR